MAAGDRAEHQMIAQPGRGGGAVLQQLQAHSSGDSRCAAIPEPITTVTSSPVPRNSASSRRNSGRGTRPRRHLDAPLSSVKIEAMNTERTTELDRRAAIHAALADPARLRIVDTLTVGDASPSELAAMLAMPSNLLAHHLNALERA